MNNVSVSDVTIKYSDEKNEIQLYEGGEIRSQFNIGDHNQLFAMENLIYCIFDHLEDLYEQPK